MLCKSKNVWSIAVNVILVWVDWGAGATSLVNR